MARTLAAIVCTLLLMAACSRPAQFSATDVTGADWGKDFHLTDQNGKPRQLADFNGRAVALFFGYTHCPDFCPTTLATLAEVDKSLGPDADKLQVLFVTLDPERDTPAVLSQYVPAFNPSFLGLYGDAAATRQVADAFKVFYQKQPGTTANNYTLDHGAATYIFDPKGRLRLYVAYGTPPDKIAADIRQLLDGK